MSQSQQRTMTAIPEVPARPSVSVFLSVLSLLALTALAPAGPTLLAAQEPAPGTPTGEGTREVIREVTLEEALERARERNASLRMARAGADRAGGQADVARSALLPHLGVRAGWLRTDDPVGTFGIELRHRSFGQEDLALDALNRPMPRTDWTGTVSLRWGGLDPAAWQRRIAADRGAEAANLSARWAAEATDYRTRVLYVEAAAAEARVAAARAAREAARATLERFRRRHEEGLLTRADLLQARAELEAARAAVEDAGRGRTEARLILAVHLGWGADTVPVPADSLSFPAGSPGDAAETPPAGSAGSSPPASRWDLRALDARVRAAEAAVRASRAEFLPSASVFGELGRHASEPFGAGGTVWTLGAGVEVPLFAGGGRIGRAEAAEAELRSVRAALDGAMREAATEFVRARDAVAAAERGVEASRAAWEAATEGRDLMRRRFEEGLASAADLLAAEARTAAMRERVVDALAAYHTARARLELASGQGSTGSGDQATEEER